MATIAVDVIWFFFVAKHLWKPHLNEIYAAFLAGYFKFSVLIVIFILIVKLVIVFLLFSELNIDESQDHIVSIFGKEFSIRS